jgi:phage shock protein C
MVAKKSAKKKVRKAARPARRPAKAVKRRPARPARRAVKGIVKRVSAPIVEKPVEEPVFQRPVQPAPPVVSKKKVYRSGKDKIIGGVCGGVAEFFGIDPTIVRLIWVLASLLWGFGVLAYIIAWIVIPKNPEHPWN